MQSCAPPTTGGGRKTTTGSGRASRARSLLAILLGAGANIFCTHLFSYTLAVGALLVFQLMGLTPQDLYRFFTVNPLFLLTSTAASATSSFIGGAICACVSGKLAGESQVLKNAALTAALLLLCFILRLALTNPESLLESPAWSTIAPFVLEMPCCLLGARWILNKRKPL